MNLPSLAPELQLPLTILGRYTFFLARRPISASNEHFLSRRLDALRSLVPLLEGRGHATLDTALRRLRGLGPTTLHAEAGAIERTIAPLLPPDVPPRFVVSSAPPRQLFSSSCRRLLLIYGPAIGLGDETLAASFAQALRAASPDADLRVLTTAPVLWKDAAKRGEINGVRAYEDGAELVAALRGEGPEGPRQGVIMVDFEKPGLLHAMARESTVDVYVEVAIGARETSVVDRHRRWLYRFCPLLPRAEGFYHFVDHAQRWLGLAPPIHDRETRPRPWAPKPGAQPPSLLISPFTSKYDPRLPFWTRLLHALVRQLGPNRLRLVFDTGPNASTARFSRELSRAVVGLSPSVCCERAEDQPPGLSLDGLLAALERADAVLVADSFAGHAAARLGRPTLVLAPPGYEAWRVPGRPAFYFETRTEPAALARGLVTALEVALDRALDDGASAVADARRGVEPAGKRLYRARVALAAFFATRPTGDALESAIDGYLELLQALDELRPELISERLATLCADRTYGDVLDPLPPHRISPIPSLDPGTSDLTSSDLTHLDGPDREAFLGHIEALFQRWQTTNLDKYLGLLYGPGTT